jgi:transcriptional regulator with XRE-family HTH domain
VAVKTIRETCGETQEQFARRIGVASMTISRFERGSMEPREPRVLYALRKTAQEKGLTKEYEHIDIIDLELRAHRLAAANPIEVASGENLYASIRDLLITHKSLLENFPQGSFRTASQVTLPSLREWRLSCAVRLSMAYFPDAVAAIEKAASAAMVIVDEVISGADESRIDYQQFERDAFALADRKMLIELKATEKGQEQ